MSDWTPGPWEPRLERGRYYIRRAENVTPGPTAIAQICNRDMQTANARLIAAAPEMVESLREMARHADNPASMQLTDIARWLASTRALLRRIDGETGT